MGLINGLRKIQSLRELCPPDYPLDTFIRESAQRLALEVNLRKQRGEEIGTTANLKMDELIEAVEKINRMEP